MPTRGAMDRGPHFGRRFMLYWLFIAGGALGLSQGGFVLYRYVYGSPWLLVIGEVAVAAFLIITWRWRPWAALTRSGSPAGSTP